MQTDRTLKACALCTALLLIGGALAWRTTILHRDNLIATQARLDERTRERDLLKYELAIERQRLRALERAWSAKLTLVQAEKMKLQIQCLSASSKPSSAPRR